MIFFADYVIILKQFCGRGEIGRRTRLRIWRLRRGGSSPFARTNMLKTDRKTSVRFLFLPDLKPLEDINPEVNYLKSLKNIMIMK